MFQRHEVTLVSNPTCYKTVDDLSSEDFYFYDKDGFELSLAERKFYSAMKYPIHYPLLNHCCWQEPWFELEPEKAKNLLLDHSMFLCRCDYTGAAYEQLLSMKKINPYADLMVRTKAKWGFDFALDAVAYDGTVYEVIHIEYDHNDYATFRDKMIQFDYMVRHTDWHDAATKIWNARGQWEGLKGFEQNHWKAKYLINWNKAEYTEKAV